MPQNELGTQMRLCEPLVLRIFREYSQLSSAFMQAVGLELFALLVRSKVNYALVDQDFVRSL